MADDLGLSERDKELKKWEKPWVYVEFPKMLYRGVTVAGRVEVEQHIVGRAEEEAIAFGAGWRPNAAEAVAVETAHQENLGTLAAERAAADRRLSAAAQADAAVIDQATLRHLPEIPARPRRPRPRPKKAAPERTDA
jgi:hypothetical protein